MGGAAAAGGGREEVGGSGGPREFYEFVLPPVDIREDPSGPITVVADVPGFGMEDISVRVHGDLLTIRAERRSGGGGGEEARLGRAVSLQRPRRLDKTVRLPARIDGPAAESCTASCAGGVLTVSIPRARSAP